MNEPKIIHIIGKVGAGKTTFIRKFFPNANVFDIKEVYDQFGFTPQQIKEKNMFSQFANAIYYRIDKMIKAMEKNEEDLLIIESSGINHAINKAIQKYERILILIDSNFEKKIIKERPYAKELNKIIKKALKEEKIKYDIIFKWKSLILEIKRDIPENFMPIISNLNEKIKKFKMTEKKHEDSD
ncbi:MAG: hypothetical protein ACTSRZ_18690 [Promethearchaeota archaeon]